MAAQSDQEIKGNVEQVRREWSVYEDGAIAHQLQEEENTKHYSGNISRRRTVREDIVKAKDYADEEAMTAYQEELDRDRQQREIEDMDRRAAEDLYKQLLQEEKTLYERQRSQEDADAEFARHLQEKEQRKFERHQLKKKERELRKERHRLEQLIRDEEKELGGSLPGYSHQHSGDEDEITNAVAGMSVSGAEYPPDQLPPEGYDEDFAQNNADKRLSDEPPAYADEDLDPDARQLHDDEEFARLLEEQERKRKSKHRSKDIAELTAHDEEIARKIQQEEELMAKRSQYKRHQKKVSAEIADPDPMVALRSDLSRQQSMPSKMKYGEGGIMLTSYKPSEEVAMQHRHHSLPAHSQASPSQNHTSEPSSPSSVISPSQTIDIAATLDPTYRPDPTYQPGDVEGITLLKKTPLNESLPPPVVSPDDEEDGRSPSNPDAESDPNFRIIQGTRRKSDSKKEKKNSKGLFGKLKKKK